MTDANPSQDHKPGWLSRTWVGFRSHVLIHPRRVWALLCITGLGLLSFGLYLQHVEGLEPCPMCIMQRYVWVVMTLFALLGALTSDRAAVWIVGIWQLALASAGAYVAARQSWLQWYPPETMSCGRDFYGIVDNFPLHQALPMIFRGSGDCSAVEWTFLGGSIANWSFVWFVIADVLVLMTLWFALLNLLRSRRASQA
jgi:disulfide bond formation protein DsbB